MASNARTGRDSIEDIYPLSPLQEGMLFEAVYAPELGFHFQQLRYTLRGELDPAAFRGAWRQVFERHQPLRTAFVWERRKKPLQVVHRQVSLPWEEVDLRGLGDREARLRVAAFVDADRERGFSFVKAPLTRLSLLRLADDTHQFVWSYHHIILDGWSVARLLQEVLALYNALRRGHSLELEPVRPYGDYIAWLGTQDAAAAEAFWRRELAGFTAPTRLGIERVSGAKQAHDEERQDHLPPAVATGLQTFARHHQITLNTLVQGAWAVVLGRYGHSEDVLFGTTVSGRPAGLPGAESMVGLLINTQPVRVHMAAAAPLIPWLQQLQARQLEARQYEYTPLAEIQGWSDVARGTALFESLLVFENFPGTPSQTTQEPALQVSSVDSVESTSYPLTLMVRASSSLLLRLFYERTRFDGAAMARLLGHLKCLLLDMARAGDRLLSDLCLLAEPERHLLLLEWNDTAARWPSAACLHELIEEQVERSPEAVAVVFADQQLTYRQLDRRANRLARHLRSLGVGPEVPVAVLVERSVLLPTALLGVLKAGGYYLPLDPDYPGQRLAFMIEDSGAQVLLAQEHLLSRLVDVEPWAGASRTIRLDVEWDAIRRQPGERPAAGALVDHPAYAIYTSGSTGRPKGVVNSHRAIVNRLLWMQQAYQLSAGDRVLQKTPASFDVSVWEFFWPLLTGVPLVLARPGGHQDAGYMARLIVEQQITTLHFVPSMLQVFLDEPAAADCVCLQRVIASGEALSIELADRFAGRLGASAELHNLYGPTEAAVDVTYHPAAPVHRKPGMVSTPIGRPITNLRIHLLDLYGQPVSVEVPGELCIGGIGLARGYLHRQDLTAERFIPDPFGEAGGRLYRTGDLARHLADGSIEFLGRIDHQVKLRGIRIELGEIESALRARTSIREAVVMVREDLPGDRRLVAYAVKGEGERPNEAELRESLRQSLPEHMVPSVFVFLDTLPLTLNGKLDRRALPAPAAASSGPQPGDAAARTPLEEVLSDIWSEVLGLERVGALNSFFELGGHSLLAMRVVSRVRQIFGVELALRELFEAPTISALAARVERRILAGERPARPPIERAERSRELPLSFAQQRLWFIDQLDPASSLYNIPIALRAAGPLQPALLERSLDEVARRHESLRTVFAATDGVPRQVIRPAAGFHLPVIDLSALDEPQREERSAELAAQEAIRPFDLGRGPVWRAHLLRLGEAEHVVLLTLHHIVGDGWSVQVLLREVASLYRACLGGDASPLPELAVQYADYAAWQRSWLSGPVLAAEVEYWRRQLAGAPPLLELPADRPRPAAQSFRGAVEVIRIAPQGLESLRALCRQQGSTLFMTLLAAFQTLLSHSTRQLDVSVGTPVAGRSLLETEALIGLFVNTLVLRTSLAGDPRFLELLERIRSTVLEAYAHQEVPFEKVVEELEPERSLSHSPLFQVMLTLQNRPVRGVEVGGLAFRPLGSRRNTAKFDLSLELEEGERGMVGGCEYSTDLFDRTTIQRLLARFERLLAGVVAQPAQRLSELPLLAEAERAQLLREWNDARLDYPHNRSLHELVDEQVDRTPDRVAVVCGEERLSYGELDRRSNQLAHHLRTLGIAAEVPVGVLVERSLLLPVALLGVLKAGGCYVPLDGLYPRQRLAFMLENSRAKVLLTEERLLGVLSGHDARPVCLDRDRAALAAESGRRPALAAQPEALAYLIYTSGSTGRPKGVAIPHRGPVALVRWSREVFGEEELSAVLAATSICFDLSVFELFVPLSRGGAVVLAQNALELPGLAAAAEVRLINTVPSAMSELLGIGGLPPGARTVSLAGEPLRSSLVEQIYLQAGVQRVLNLYGPSEDTTYSTWTRIDRGAPGEPTIGRPVSGGTAWVTGQDLRLVSTGVPGEVCLGGAGLARGYLGQPELTAERFVPDPFGEEAGGRLYRTGDLGRHLPDGRLEFLGRIDHQVKIRGFRIELGEIETALRAHPAVAEAVVVVREDAPGDRRLTGYVVLRAAGRPRAMPAVAELREHLRRTLPEHMVPSAWVELASLPRTPNGKVDRKALPVPAATGSAPPDAAVTVLGGPIEESVAAIWAEVLGTDRIGSRSDFFELGGHSLLATRVVSRLRALFGVDLPLRALFEARTVAALAERLESGLRAGAGPQAPPIEPASHGGPLPLSFSQERLWFLHQLAPDSPAYNMPGTVRFHDGLDFPALAMSLSEVVRRHESLRTVFHPAEDGGAPVQQVLPAAALPLPVVDLGGLPEESRRGESSRLARDEARRPFDLESGPLLRVCLLRLAAAEGALLATLHHIVGDAWSLRVLGAEVAALYAAFRAGKPSPLPEPSLQYADFAVWQRRWLQGEVLEAQLGYWRRQLRGLPPLVPLPAVRPCATTSRARGGMQRLRLAAETAEGLRRLARTEGGTLFIVLLAGLEALLCRYTGQTDFCVGTPIAGRNRLETERLIGCFLNTLALRADLSGNPSFRELLGRVRETSLGAYAHQDLPFERLLEELQPERDLQRTPVFQVMFNLLNVLAGAARADAPFGGEKEETATAGVKLDLSLHAEERGGEIEILFHYDADLFDAAQMAAMADHLRHLLAQAAAVPDRRLSEMSLESAGDRQRRLAGNRVAPSSPWIELTRDETAGAIAERFQHVAGAHPSRLAVVTAGHCWTYEHLDRLSSGVAGALVRRLGDQPRVALLFGQDAPRIAAVLAALKAGKTYVPLDPSYPRVRLAAVLRDAAVAGILAEEAHFDLAADLAAGEIPVLPFEEADASDATGLPRVAPETPAYILYTSGSTGEPKGVVQSHRNVLHHIRTYTNALHIVAADRLSLLASYAFDAAVMDIFGALLNGASLHPFDVRGEGTAALARWLREQRITIYHSTPTLYRRLLEDAAGGTFPDVRLVVLGGEKCMRRDLERFRSHFPGDSLFVNGLGPTESTLALQLFATPRDVIDRETVPVGYPVDATEVILRNSAGEQVAVYGVGEIEICSPYVALGYWRRPDLTAALFLDDPGGGERRTYRTGDLGRWLPDGSLEFVGREDSQVKVRGHRIELGEVEAVLASLSGVREAVVVAREEEAGEPRLAAYLLAVNPEGLDTRRLRRELQQRLPEPMIPADFVILETWPLTPTGKVDRAALPPPSPDPRQGLEEAAAPSTPLEELLCGIWAEVLGLERVGVQDDFFALGGHSLLATGLLARIRRVWSAEIPLRAVFEAPTARQMAARLEEALRTVETVRRPALVPVPRQGLLPLSFAQQRLWFLEQLQPGTAAYNLPAAVRLSGVLDVPALAVALADLASRHEVLRARFADVEGEAVQEIVPAGPVPLPVIDLGALPPGMHVAEGMRLAREEARRPFDLARGPLFRAGLLRLDDREHALLASFHHIVTDGWSQGIFWRELSALYDARVHRREPSLPELPLQYADFACWQRRWLTGEVVAGQLAYWRQRLYGIPAQLGLPFDRPRPVLSSLHGASRPLRQPAALAARVRDLGRRTGTTPFMILLASLQALLARYTGEQDVCVGTPIAGRTHVEVEGLIGLFVNTLVMRGDLAGDPSFVELLGRTRDAALQAHAHQDLPFERLVEELQPDRSLGVPPLFQVMLAFQNVRRETPRLAEVELGAFAISTGTVKFDLSLTAVDTPEGIGGTLEYAADLFDAATVDRLLGHLGVLLEGATGEPGCRLSALPLLRPGERHQLLVEWGDTAAADPRESLCLHEIVLAQARRTPEAVAVISRDSRLAYGDLERQSARLAARLTAAGVGRGAFVPVLLDGGPGLVVAFLGVMRTGAAFVPLDPAWPTARRNAILEEIGAGVMLVKDGSPPELGAWRSLGVEDGVDEGVSVAEAAAAQVPPEAPIYAIYTSGSTGRPKGVVIPHRGIVNRFLWMDRFFGVDAAARVLQTTRHVYDSAVWQLFWPLTHGGATVLTEATGNADPDSLCGLIERYRVTLTDFVPAVFNLLVQQLLEGSQAATQLVSLRAVVVGGEEMGIAAARSFLELFPEVCLVNLYGPTEASIGCICHRVETADDGRGRVPIGRPISNVHPVILDRWGSPVPVGVAGELCLSGRCLALSYLRDGSQTGRAFVPNPSPEIPQDRLYRTGDLARLLPDGRIDLLGRIDRQVKIRGLRIELGEIETALRRHPRVGAVAVLAWQTPDVRDRLLVACCTGQAGDLPAEAELREFLREQLPSYMVPALFVPLESLPLTEGGKVDRRLLAALVAERWRPAVAADGAAPRTPYEDLLAGIWTDLLGRDRVGLEDDFFALGGHSLLATRVVSRIRKVVGVELPIRALFEAPTVAGLAQRVEEEVRAGVTAALPPLRPVPRAWQTPLSFAQQRLWFLDRLTPGVAIYRLFTPFFLEGALDPAALARSLGEIARRHESLRTSFPEVDGEPVQAVAAASDRVLPRVDLDGLPEEVRQAEALRWIEHEASRPFDLARGPLLRALLLRLAPDHHAVLLGAHHIVCDGWSLRILLRELTVLYQALSCGEPSPLPELPVQYADFAVWQRSWMQGETLEREVDYWRRQLAGAPAVLELPADRPRPAVQSFRGASLPVALPPGLVGGLGRLAREEGSTLFMALLAGLDALLLRYTGQPRIVVGTPVANRGHAELEDLIGNFANTLVLAATLEPGLSCRAALGRVRESALGAYAHQDLPFEVLVEALCPRRDLSHNPLFQVLFGLHNLPPARMRSTSGLHLRPLGSRAATARFDLALDLVESPEGFRGSLEYATDLFDAATAERIAGHLLMLLEGAVADPEARLDELPLLTELERQQTLQEWSGSWEEDLSAGRCLHELFEAWARRTPGAVALVCGGERLTYGDLDRRANRLAHRLRRLGAGPEVPVGLCLERSVDLVAALLGILKAGAAYVPLDPAYPRQRLAWILESAAVPLLVTRGSLAGSFPEHGARIVDLEADSLAAEEDGPPGPVARPDNLAYAIFTSGSTGGPKGVQITHRSAVHLMETAGSLFGFGPEDTWTVVHSFAFDFSVWEIWGALAHGGRLVVAPLEVVQSPADFAELLLAEGVTVLHQTPSAVRQLMESGGEAAERALGALRLLACGGEALPRELVPELLVRAGQVWNFYGPTESTVWAAAGPVGLETGEGAVSLGRPLPDNQLLVLDAAGQLLPAGVPGELCIAGAGLARGYLRMPGLTAGKFVPHPLARHRGERLYRTGDLVRRRADGALEFLGRIDQQVKVRGFRIELGEIESVLVEHPGVAQVVVTAPAAGPGERELLACLVLSGEGSPPVDELRRFAASRLPAYMIPARFIVLERFPLTPNGKVDRRALSELWMEQRRSATTACVPPRDDLEMRLVHIWEALLPGRRIGVTDDFFDLGGHSLLAVRLLARIRTGFGQDLPVSTLFQHSTVERLAAVLRRSTSSPVRPILVAIRPEMPALRKRPFFLVHPIGGNVLCYRDLARYLGPDQPVYGLQTPELRDGSWSGIESFAHRYLEEVRSIQAHGPYALGGWSLGGLIAFEMARLLHGLGERVAPLVLIDSEAPRPATQEPATDLIAWFCHDLARSSDVRQDLPLPSHGGDLEERLRRTHEWALAAGLLPEELGYDEIRKLFSLFRSNAEALRGYTANAYPRDLVLFRAADAARRNGDPARGAASVDLDDTTLGWGALAGGGVSVRMVPGDHFTMIREPHVAVLAEQVIRMIPLEGA